ncbi:sensor histidine kinase [Spirosoma radiotolerans]|uniref:histidine kinase n=1 Tax=Spirosoma radiotolerans TaxID=1379870 RepID=A0A0E3ZTT2_9BACT|nr:HAMP domain-containing sensor histidine kinase [Spirosoma radiotolerans]AKD54200.1 hypothetical protein SD10_04035 [Spirosoma radiotolerans]
MANEINDQDESSPRLDPSRYWKDAEKALRSSQEHFRMFLTTISDAVYRMNADWSQMLTLEGQEFLATTEKPSQYWFKKYIPLQDQPQVQAAIEQAIETKSIFELEHRIILADGTIGWTLSRAIPLLNTQSKIVEWVGVASDITQRKQAEESLNRLQKRTIIAVEAAEMATWEWHLAANQVYWNEQHFKLLGMPLQPEPMQPADFLSHIHPDDRQRVTDQLTQAIEQQGIYDTDFRIIRDDGTLRWMSGYGRITEEVDGRPSRMSGVMFDITDRKQAEEELKEGAQRKDEFMALLAHELRNPLATLSNTVQILQLTKGTNEMLPLESALTLMSREVSHLVRLVDDLLDVSRINQGKTQLRLASLDLTSLVRQAIEAARPLVETGQRQFMASLPGEPLYMQGDDIRLTQMIRDLLSNAAKFTHNNGHVWLTLEQVGGEACLRIRDDGIGIAADQLDRIFTMFVQVDTSSIRSQGGLGLGLTLVKQFAELHGGRVEVASAGVGAGSEFSIYLPLKHPNHTVTHNEYG